MNRQDLFRRISSLPRQADTIGETKARTRTLEFSGRRTKLVAGANRMIRGALQNDGHILAGSGFTVDLTASVYTITFDVPFLNPPIVPSLAPNNNNPPISDGTYGVSLSNDIDARLTTQLKVIVTNFDGTSGEGGFDFLAIEP